MISLIDKLLNRITMYRLVLYYLMILLAVAAVFGAIGWLPYSPLAILFSSVFLTIVCWTVNRMLASTWHAQPNSESAYITALILALIATPVMPTAAGIGFLALVAVIAMASKYIFALNKKHIFNPAAIAVVITGFTIGQPASWWVGGNLPLLGFVVIGGLLVVRKMQRFDLVLAFLAAAFASIIITHLPTDAWSTAEKAILHTPIFFFASIMITEPLTTPPRRGLRIAYGALVGLLFAPAIHIGSIYSTPELALVTGNVFSYLVSPKKKYVLALKEKNAIGGGMYDFVFADTDTRADANRMNFQPGQYLEWTLGHPHADGRGNRRYFTVASSPTENNVRLGIRFYEPPSSFKKTMLGLEPGATIVAGQLAGDFTMPRDPSQKLAFIAGGIGITPFRSMIKYLTDRGEKRDVVLLYSNRTAGEIAYRTIFDEARTAIGMKTVYAITDADGVPPGELAHHGRIDAELIKREIPDYRERMFYISGTHTMTSAFKKTLAGLGVPRTHIKTDFFPGFA